MSRPLRIDRAGAWYHIMNRGANRQRIFQDDADRRHWLALLADMVERFRMRVHAYVLMDNHYHLIVEALEANLSLAIQWLQVSYSMWHNLRHGRIGPLFQGRFRSVVVEGGAWAYELSVYVHLNPLQREEFRLSRTERKAVRLGLGRPPSAEECRRRLKKLRGYRWSSYRAYAGYERAPKWLRRAELLKRAGGEAEYRKYVQHRLRDGADEGIMERLRDRFAVGTEAFREVVCAVGREKGREIAGRNELKKCVSFENMVKAAEKIAGESFQESEKRRGTLIKPLALWGGRWLCGLTMREIGEGAGGMDYNAVNMALRRWEERMKREPSVAALAEELRTMCNV